jgi:hypothetical protein
VVLTTVPSVPLVLGVVVAEVAAAAVVVGVVVGCDRGREAGAVSGTLPPPGGVMIDIGISQLKKCWIAAQFSTDKSFPLICICADRWNTRIGMHSANSSRFRQNEALQGEFGSTLFGPERGIDAPGPVIVLGKIVSQQLR